MMKAGAIWLYAAFWAVLAALGPAAVRAQTQPDAGSAPPAAGADAPGPLVPLAVGTNEITVQVMSLGIGNRPRPGSWAGMEVELNDGGSKPRDVMVRLSFEDNDGDTVQMQRAIVANPGKQRVWLYLRLPFDAAQQRTFVLTVYEAFQEGDGADRTYRIGRVLGSTQYRIAPGQAITSQVGLIGVVGARAAGLDQYQWVWSQSASEPHAVTGHEATATAQSLLPSGLPDRWMGLGSLEALVWTGAGVQEQPSNLRPAQAQAIKDWVRRGGHLIVVLPSVAQQWIGSNSNPLADIMPQVRVSRLENQSLDNYRTLFTRDPRPPLPQDAVVQSFDPADDGGWGASGGGSGVTGSERDVFPLMRGANGDVVAVRRLVGAGAVSVVGLDLASPKLATISGALQADQFWNRMLGKRLRVLSPAELLALQRPPGNGTPQWVQGVEAVEVDTVIASEIANQTQAATGVLMAFLVFIAYWLIAGPVGFFLLKSRGLRHYSWLGFVGATAVFTVVAWSGANLLKIRNVQGKHISFVTSVYGQPTQHVLGWAGVFLPRYGEQRISIANPASAAAGADESVNALAAWEMYSTSQTGPSGALASFPDARGYAVEARSPDTASVPARATAKEIQFDWSGTLSPQWGGIRPIADSSVPVGQEIRIVPRQVQKSQERRWGLQGVLSHTYPTELKNVKIVLVMGQHNNGLLLPESYAVSLPEWKPSAPLTLDTVFDVELKAAERASSFLSSILPGARTMGGVAGLGATFDPNSAASAASFFSSLEPPPPTSLSGWRVLAQRRLVHPVDLSRWFTQPCLVVIGELDNSELPVPMSVDSLDRAEIAKRVKGKSIVRWVYPLQGAPSQARPPGPSPADAPGQTPSDDAPSAEEAG